MKDRRKGFTLTELTVVLVIMAIITAIAVPFFVKYWRLAEFRKNESNARTVYLAAESRLTWYRTSGQWEQFQKRVKAKGLQAEFDDDEHSDLNGRIYTLTLDAGAYDTDTENPILDLIDASAYDKSFLKAAIAVEIDVETGEVYSAFYGTKCKSLNYADSDAGGSLTMKDRAYESRQKRLLGYYSAKDTANVVNLDPKRLRITTISLLNSEKLTLNWSSNVGAATDVSYELTFYQADEDKEKLFSLVMSPYDMHTAGWDGQSGTTSEMASFTLQDKDGKESASWDFPVSLSNNTYSLVLDAMMSAETIGTLEAKADTTLQKTESTSILRLADVAEALKENQNIYATVKAISYAGPQTLSSDNEYRDSEVVSSNTAATLYGDDTKGNDVTISTWRHLSNIRYADTTKSVTYTLTAKNMDWASVGTGVYSLALAGTGTTGDATLKPCWSDNGTEVVDFPTIPELSSHATLKGNGSKTLLSNLQLGADSVLEDETVMKVYSSADANTKKTRYLGLFAENNGTIEKVTFSEPSLSLTTGTKTDKSEAVSFTALQGIGILAGRSSGDLNEITVEAEKTAGTTRKANGSDTDTIYVNLSQNGSKAAVGGLVGVLADETEKNGNYTYKELGSAQLASLTMNGTMDVVLPADTFTAKSIADDSTVETTAASQAQYGIGGIAGYAYLDNQASTAKLKNCTNHADLSGNLLTGGIVGRLKGSYDPSTASTDITEDISENISNIVECESDGLILSTADAATQSLIGRYFGGIAGYSQSAILYGCETASGRAKNYSYSSDQRQTVLKGDYVGGIVGFGDVTVLNDCATQKNGYVLGANYVGGIAGALGTSGGSAIRVTGAVSVTTNRSYVIGETYVGGITGRNEEHVTLENCINNGIAAAYGKYAGGIVGYNEKGAMISDCASYLSDYDSSIYKMIVETWQATGDYVGGIAGYNNGQIKFDSTSEKVTVKAVSSIVAGKSYVGGIAGFNDVKGTLAAAYELIGGRIYGTGDAVGGCFGLNASESILTQDLVIKPRSVEGRYYVGGVIGANVVALSKDVEASKLRTDNSLGTIRGTAFVGGIIGYERTYGEKQLTADETTGGIRAALETAQSSTNANEKLLPDLTADKLPESVIASTNTYTLTLTTAENKDSFTTDTNKIPLEAGYYAGGIVGYCEKDSRLVIKNCRNAGNISLLSSVGADQGIELANFVKSKEVNSSFSDETVKLHFVGGIIGVNLENQVIDHCTNTGNMSDSMGIGGIVGLNAGYVYDCSLNGNFGNAGLSYLGGIAAINIQPSDTRDKSYSSHSYTAGTIEACSTAEGRTVTGKDTVGGIVAWNLADGQVKESVSNANVTGAGDRVGGVAGRNSGTLTLKDEGTNSVTRTVQSTKGQAVGGIVGQNEAGGILVVTGSNASSTEIVAAGSGLTVRGKTNVGGIIGVNEGNLGDNEKQLVSQVKLVQATEGNAGGVVGSNEGNITKAVNRSTSVTADRGNAGGITGVNASGHTITSCTDYGSVTTSDGYVGGIVAQNAGTIQNSTVTGTSAAKVTLTSHGTDEMGAICAVNTGTIEGSKPTDNVTLQGDAAIFGGITGRNQGTVTNTELKYMPEIPGSGTLTVGGAVGVNEKDVNNITSTALTFVDFTNYRYLGGIVGQNGLEPQSTESDGSAAAASAATVTDCTFSGTITEKQGVAGNCYGGIAGINYATLAVDKVDQITLSVQGVYTATSTSSAEEKEALATHAGGITGKNETNAKIERCVLKNNANSSLTAAYGMLGGIAGFNKGTITGSGSEQTSAILKDTDVTDNLKNASVLEKINGNASYEGLTALKTYVTWKDNTNVENLSYNQNSTSVTAGCVKLILSTNGNLGGITAYNSTEGALDHCVSGKWFLNNKSEAIGVGTGGIIGMNESEKDLSYLVNGAFVGRQIASGQTNRFAGGIIGNQNNSTSSDWTISYCVNYGMVYCYNSHYSGGIMGQWTGSGGTIENCRNYGNLQTTYAAGWVGASGGIVAQLYHAYEDNEYNIIGCGNYGNLYKRNGTSGTGANDSAGILGNITNFEASNAANSQSYSVQILDCFNAPGVEIYSNSMASGIFGFLSCDNAYGNNITTSTANVDIRVERCRNFAKKLISNDNSNNYVAGIFGDRYGQNTDAWQNHTVVKDCYALNLGSSYYSRTDRPIYSALGGRTGAGPAVMSEENRKNNFYFEGIADWGFTNVKIGNGQADSSGSGSANNGHSASGLNEQYITSAFFIYDITNQKYMLVDLKKNNKNNYLFDGNTGYINSKNQIESASGEICGTVLFSIDGKKYNNALLLSSAATDPQDILFLNTRESYRRLEGIMEVDGTKKLLAPSSVSAKIEDGKIQVTVKPQFLPYADGTTSTEYCDPFAYDVTVTDGNGHQSVHRIYSESGSFAIPTGLSGEMTVSVKAVSMFDDVENSDAVQADGTVVSTVLPDPQVRIEVVQVSDKGTQNAGSNYNEKTRADYRYRITLENLDEYQAKKSDGTELYPGWNVKVNIQNMGVVTLNDTNTTADIAPSNSNISIYQMVAQAYGDGLESSKEISTAVNLHYYYRADLTLQEWTPQASPSYTVTGTTLDDLTVTVTLDASSYTVTTPPVYRVELLGDWIEKSDTGSITHTDTVLAKTDVLTVSRGKATATFQNLPEYIGDADNLRLRIWYASSGLGPVYTYWNVDSETDANVKELSQDENGDYVWTYLHSTTLQSSVSSYYKQYQYNSTGTLFTWLPKPDLGDADSATAMTPQYNGDKLLYTFQWDQGKTGSDYTNATYQVSLTGIDANGNEVIISTEDAYKDATAKILTIDGSDWNYTSVKLKVTRVGYTAKNGSTYIGLSSTGTYTIKPRLEAPAQPSVTIVDHNELDYTLTWAANASEEGMKGYQAYVQTYDEQGNLQEAAALGELVTTNTNQKGIYTETVSMEDYAGQKVVIYLKAIADPNGAYLDSLPGITTEVTIPSRLKQPNVTWKPSWTYNKDVPTGADVFLNQLQINLTADKGSIPPGGSGYLLRAYVFDTEAEAKNATKDTAMPTDASFVYPVSYGESKIPVQMDVTSTTDYYHVLQNLSIKYAGKWIVFYARISSGSGTVSSAWTVASDPIRLPKVQLDSPSVTSNSEEGELTATVTTTPNVPGTAKTWSADYTTLTWDSVDCADLYTFTLEGSRTNDGTIETLSATYRIKETEAGLTLEYKDEGGAWKTIDQTEDDTTAYSLEGYQVEVGGNYTPTGSTGNYSYETTLTAKLTVTSHEDGTRSYQLTLPDVSGVTATDRLANGTEATTVITNDAFRLTTRVSVTADVQENLNGQTSEAYAASAPNETTFQ